jgi:ATPase subunit of ABC transporter with duplicated ATPase domains
VWVLYDKRIIDFDGGFEEWEEVAAERLHAARVRAAESEARHRIHERQAVERPHRPDRDRRTSARKARERLAVAEARVAELEKTVDHLTSTLEDPALYTKVDGPQLAAAMGRELDEARAQLDAAIAEWEQASVEVDQSVE